VQTFTVLTAKPNEQCAPIHNRIPVIRCRENWPAWLGEIDVHQDELLGRLGPYPTRLMCAYPSTGGWETCGITIPACSMRSQMRLRIRSNRVIDYPAIEIYEVRWRIAFIISASRVRKPQIVSLAASSTSDFLPP
jgi:SOS response associated peptidase (SRAP)